MAQQSTRRTVLERLARVNRTGVFLATLALLIAALLLPAPFSGIVLLVLAAGLIWLLTLTWPLHDSRTRVTRVLVLAVLIAVAVSRL